MKHLPDPNEIFPNEYKNMCFIKNVIKASNIMIGDYTYYDDNDDPTTFEQDNILFNYPEFKDKLIIGKFCAIASGVKFIMGSANHRMSSVTTYPFNVFKGQWANHTPNHLSQLPFKGDIVVGNDVWIGRECIIMPGVKIGDGSIIAAYSVVVKDVSPYCVIGGNPATFIKKRLNDELIELLLELKWWDFEEKKLVSFLPLLCETDLLKVQQIIKQELHK